MNHVFSICLPATRGPDNDRLCLLKDLTTAVVRSHIRGWTYGRVLDPKIVLYSLTSANCRRDELLDELKGASLHFLAHSLDALAHLCPGYQKFLTAFFRWVKNYETPFLGVRPFDGSYLEEGREAFGFVILSRALDHVGIGETEAERFLGFAPRPPKLTKRKVTLTWKEEVEK